MGSGVGLGSQRRGGAGRVGSRLQHSRPALHPCPREARETWPAAAEGREAQEQGFPEKGQRRS